MATSKASHRAGRMSLALTSTTPCDDIPILSPQRIPPAVPQEEPCSSWYKPPARRLQDALQECAEIDHELKVLETSGHTRVGAFAKTLAMKPKIGTKLRSSSGNEEPKDLSDDDEDASTDPFINQFYDDQGRTLSEQLLRGRMRVLALVKLIHGHHSISKAHAELELGETYARMNLWKQAELHASCAANLLREIEISSQKEKGSAKTRGQKDNGKLLRLALEFCYEAQCDEAARGRVSADELLVHLNKDGEAGSHNQLVAAVFARGVLEKAFESNQSLHWQKLLLRLEEISEELHQHLTFVSARLAPGVAQMLNALFVSLDTAEDGIVPFHTFLDRLQTANTDLSNCKSSSASYIQALCGTLQRVLNRVCYHSLTWTEILTLGANNNLRLPSSDDSRSDDDSLPALLARVKLLLSRVYLRRGQLEDAVRYVQAAVVARERIYAECSDLVPFYLVAAEAQARRGRQLRVLGQQARRDRSERWLQTTEGSRHLRSRALEEVELASGSGEPLLTKKDAEARARVKLIQELTISTPSTLSTNRPGNDNEASARSLMDEALESCNKAWELQERHFGREHVATAAVHVSLAQVHLLRSINEDRASADEEKEAVHEAICCFTAAIDIYENACSGTVPASAFLRLELAKLYQQDQLKRDKARAEYELVGRFFATFAAEFAGSESTKRECAALALDAFRQWITLSRNSTTSLDDQRFVLKEMNSVSVNGYGEFSIEACESAAQLARMLHRIATSRAGQREPQSEIYDKLRTATKLLRSATYIAESLLGANDRRSRKLRKDANEIESTMRSTLAGEQEDGGGHEWLAI
ncbi:hypothetical protein PC128_g3128 [Phytophthora cactorum]|nr:hypothetical protein PC128_g3128 [Phytophthora cactorum]